MPKCREVLDRYKESYAQNWAMRLVWAYQKLKNENGGRPVFWCDMRKLAGVKNIHADLIIPLLGQYADKTDADAIKSLLNL